MATGLPALIFEKIRDDIIHGVYPIGTKLPAERELSAKYNASRFAVREAIAMLAQNDFVKTLPQSGTYILDFYRDGSLETLVQTLHIRRVIDRQTLDSLLSFRYTTETNTAAEAAPRMTEPDIAYLSENLRLKKDNLGNIRVLSEIDYDFHSRVVSVSANVINRLIFKSFKPIYSFFTEFFYSLPEAGENSLALNLTLLEAFKNRNSGEASKAMGAILKYGSEKVYEAIDENEELIIIRKR